MLQAIFLSYLKTGRWNLLSLIISFCALGLTCYEAYSDRLHNVKSVKPLCQIDLGDYKDKIYVYIKNCGVGPMIIDKITFTKAGQHFSAISDCLELDPKTYEHVEISDANIKAVTPNSFLVVFEKNIENLTDEDVNQTKKQLTHISVKVNYRDIYDNKFIFEKNLKWFTRYINN